LSVFQVNVMSCHSFSFTHCCSFGCQTLDQLSQVGPVCGSVSLKPIALSSHWFLNTWRSLCFRECQCFWIKESW